MGSLAAGFDIISLSNNFASAISHRDTERLTTFRDPGDDPLRRFDRIVMLPDPYGKPAGIGKAGIRIDVSAPVAFDLLPPEVRVVPRPGRMLRATVPKTTVDEDRHTRGPEHDVRLPANALHWAPVNPVPQPGAMQQLAQGNLDPGVTALLAAHAPTYDGRRLECLHTSIVAAPNRLITTREERTAVGGRGRGLWVGWGGLS